MTGLPVPRDPVQAGECSVFVELRSLETEESIASPIRLFRFDAPGNEDWFAGDQLQVEWTVPRQGVWFRGLPAGVYRIRVAEQTHSSEDPPPFTLAGPVTRLRYFVPTPRERSSRLIVVDEHGCRLDTVGRLRVGYSHDTRTTTPSWLRARTLRHPERHVESSIRVGRRGGGDMHWRTVRGRDGEFVIPTDRESPRYEERGADTEIRVRGRTSIRVPQSPEPLAATEAWMAISLPEDMLRQTIRLPDGSVASEATIRVCADAVAVVEPPPAGFWRTLSLHVRVSLRGYEDMNFDMDLQNPPVIRVLVQSAEDPGD